MKHDLPQPGSYAVTRSTLGNNAVFSTYQQEDKMTIGIHKSVAWSPLKYHLGGSSRREEALINFSTRNPQSAFNQSLLTSAGTTSQAAPHTQLQHLLVAFAVLALSTADAQPPPGSLDPTFAGTGLARIGFGGGQAFARTAAVQGDGKLVLGGYTISINGTYQFALVRLDTNNVLDTAFGNGGKVVTQISLAPYAAAESVEALAVQPDGKIVAGGRAYDGTNPSFALLRLTPDGSPDPSFGTNGKVFTDLGFSCQITALGLLPDGKIVACGSGGLGSPGDFLLARYQTNGALDTTFGNAGIVETPMNGACYALLAQGDGTTVAAGYRQSQVALARYTTNGVLDATFGGGTGEVFTTIAGAAYATAIGYQSSIIVGGNKLVVAGNANGQLAIARYNLNGSLDTSFGTGGVLTDTYAPGWSECFAVSITGGTVPTRPVRITVAGYVGSVAHPGTNYFALARYTAAGAPDTTFGSGTGKTTVAIRPGCDDEGYALAFQSGKVVLAGFSQVLSDSSSDFAAARFNSDGSLDTSFGNAGVVLADIADLGSQALGVAVQPDGKIVVAGSASNSVQNAFALARYNANGMLDGTFGPNGGRVTTALGAGNAVAHAVVLQSDGKIIAAGSGFNGADNDFALARYNPDGSLDNAFGSGGRVTTPIGSGNELAQAVALQADGKIVAAGFSFNGANNDFAVVRYATNGALDPSFGGSGKITTSIAGAEAKAWAVSIQTDGKIVLAGQGQVGADTDFALVRYNPDGSLDNSFGAFAGRVATGFGNGTAALGLAMTLQPDGRIIVGGVLASNGVDYVALARYATNGLLDGTFGTGGQVITQIGPAFDYAASLALDPHGKIVVAAVSYQGTNFEYAALRYNPNGSLDTSYGVGGKVAWNFSDGGNDLASALALDQIGRAVIVGNANNLFGVARLASEPLLKFTSIKVLTNAQVALSGLGVPVTNNTLYAAPNLSPGSFSRIDAVTPDAGGFWQYLDTNAVGWSNRFYSLSFP